MTLKLEPLAREITAPYAVPSLEKALDILELLAKDRNGLTKSEIARVLNRTISEIFRMLICLQRRGYLIETDEGRYVLSLRLFQLVQAHPPTERLLSEALPHMHLLAEKLKQSCHLGVLEFGRVVILAQVNAPVSVGLFVRAGSAVDLMEAATGQVILAYMGATARQKTLAEWQRDTGRDVPSNLTQHLASIRSRGYERRKSYQVQGVTNISCPLRGEGNQIAAALTIPFIQRLSPSVSQHEAEKALLETCRLISLAIGANPE